MKNIEEEANQRVAQAHPADQESSPRQSQIVIYKKPKLLDVADKRNKKATLMAAEERERQLEEQLDNAASIDEVEKVFLEAFDNIAVLVAAKHDLEKP